jgi:type I restriction enzyme S subunit
MNAERLLQHYEQIADAPDAIARLRRFILDLAMRGKLVPQDTTEEPASELLKRIAKEKARAGKREKVEAEIGNEVELGELPSTWRAVPLIALGSWAIGSGFPKNEQGLESGPHFFLKVSDMNLPGNEKYITASNNFIDDDAARRMRAKIHPPGTIIFPKIGGAIATNKRRILTRGSAIDNNCLGITFSSALNVEWAFLLLTTLDFTRYQAGTAVPALQQGVLERIPVGLPPLAEQHRIVTKVDELMGLCDRLEAARVGREAVRDRLAAASLARLNAPDPETFQDDTRFALDALPALTTRPDQIKRLRQTILNLAVRGKLVPQDANDEPASELLKRIAKEKARRVSQGTLREQRPLPSIEGSEVEFELAPGWQWVRMAEVIKLWNGFAFKSGDFQSIGVPVVRIGDLQDGVVTLSGAAFVSEAVSKTVGPEVWIPSDALLIAMSGATTGKTAFNRTGTPLLLNQRVGRIEVFSINVNFLRFFFETIVARNLSISFGTAIPNLSAQQINETVIPLPPLAEQHRIVAKVDALMALCDKLEASLTAASTTRRRLLNALLTEALAPVDARELEAAE